MTAPLPTIPVSAKPLLDRIAGPAALRGLPDADADTILAAMVADPILIERPLVETDKGVGLCRPQDEVLRLL